MNASPQTEVRCAQSPPRQSNLVRLDGSRQNKLGPRLSHKLCTAQGGKQCGASRRLVSWRDGRGMKSIASPQEIQPFCCATPTVVEEQWMSYLSTTETVTLISDTPEILTIVPET
jgi:hypothetical protein